MATVLPFNSITVGGTQVAGPDDFVYGSGRITLKGDDGAVTTADGKIHNYRTALHPEGSCELRGDKRDKGTGKADKWPSSCSHIVLGHVSERGGTAVAVHEFDGVISVEYDAEAHKSTLSISGCETP